MKCKRCGTPIEPLNHLCQGCGKSIIALREDNEIIYDEQELSQVEIDKLNTANQELSKPEVEEDNTNLDVFGDALFGMESPKIESNENELNLTSDTTNEPNKTESDFMFEPEEVADIGENVNNYRSTEPVFISDSSPRSSEFVSESEELTNQEEIINADKLTESLSIPNNLLNDSDFAFKPEESINTEDNINTDKITPLVSTTNSSLNETDFMFKPEEPLNHEEPLNQEETINTDKLTDINLDNSSTIEYPANNETALNDTSESLEFVSNDSVSEVQNIELPMNNDLEIDSVPTEKLENTDNVASQIPTNDGNDVIPTEIKEPKHKKKSKIASIFIIIAIILLIVAGVVFYFYTKTSPSKIFTNSIDKFDINNSVSDNVKIGMSASMNITFDTDEQAFNRMFDIVNNLKINVNYHITENKSYLNLNPTYNNLSLLDASVYIEDEETILYLQDVYDKYIDVSEELTDSENGISDTTISDIETLVVELKKELKDILKPQFLNRSLEKININGKDKFVAKSIFYIDSSNYEKLLNNLKSNQELMRSIISLFDVTEAEISTILEEEFSNIERFEVILYSEILNNNILKYEISMKTVDNDIDAKLEIIKDDNTYNFTLNNTAEDTELKGSLVVEKEDNKNNYTLEFANEIVSMTFNLSYELEENVEIDWPDTSDRVLFSDLTEEEVMEINENFSSNEGMSEFTNALFYFLMSTSLDDYTNETDDENIIE